MKAARCRFYDHRAVNGDAPGSPLLSFAVSMGVALSVWHRFQAGRMK